MRYIHFLLWIFKLIVFVLLFGFAMQNARPSIPVHFFLGYSWNAPLALLLLIAFAIGALLGLMAAGARIVRLRRELIALRKEKRLSQVDTKIPEQPRDAV